MKKILNAPSAYVDETLAGLCAAYPSSYKLASARVVARASGPVPGKVGIVTGGGSGHLPVFLGYVGDGLLDAVAVGEIFSSPTARSFLDAMQAADGGAGVACLYGNYAGDNMNVKMAMQMASAQGIAVQTVVANDDVASAAKGDEGQRRGVAGEIFMWKVGAAVAARGGSLAQVIAAAQKAIDNTRSIGIGLSACVIPAVGKANFTIAHGNMEVGIGHHGEPGIDVRPTATAAEMAELMLAAVLPDLPFVAGDRVALLVSGLGATPLMEQYILYGELAHRLEARGIRIAFKQVGNLFSSLEMMGVTLTLMKLDDELASCLSEPCQSVGLTVTGSPAGERLYSGQLEGRVALAGQAVSSGAAAAPRLVSHVRQVVGPAIPLALSGELVRDLIASIVANRQYLSEIDGLIGDGDHGINMAKGFNGCAARLDALGDQALELPAALTQLSKALMDDIGGSMGPLYGEFFRGLADMLAPHSQLDAALFGDALAAAVANVQAMGNAKVGDKTLMDTLLPALDAYHAAQASAAGFTAALESMSDAAARGRDSTQALQARIGRSARLGPRSLGVLDAGATSCCLILHSMAGSLQRLLQTASV